MAGFCSVPGHSDRLAVAVALTPSGDPSDQGDWRAVCVACAAERERQGLPVARHRVEDVGQAAFTG